MRNAVIAALLVAVIVASAGAGHFVGRTGQQPANSASSTTTMTLTCTLSPKGSTLYFRVTLDDNKTSVTNATINATPVETCNGVDTTRRFPWQ